MIEPRVVRFGRKTYIKPPPLLSEEAQELRAERERILNTIRGGASDQRREPPHDRFPSGRRGHIPIRVKPWGKSRDPDVSPDAPPYERIERKIDACYLLLHALLKLEGVDMAKIEDLLASVQALDTSLTAAEQRVKTAEDAAAQHHQDAAASDQRVVDLQAQVDAMRARIDALAPAT